MTSEADRLNHARKTARSLPPQLLDASIACPLCGAAVSARGLKERATVEQEPVWQALFTCPSCGLITRFAVSRLSVKQLNAISGSSWANELRQYQWIHKEAGIAHESSARPRHFIGVLFISFLTWLVLTGSLVPFDILWGLVVSVVVARFSYRLVAFEVPRWVNHPRRWLYFLDVLVEFVRQLVMQNVMLSIRVLRRDLNIRPGIVAVPTKMHGDINLTVLGSLMSLTPDTVTIDIDQTQGLVYVHWIDVKTLEPEKVRQLLIADLEDRIIRWLL
jgi:multicomponent Na+:H+ antiporter subunit E